ncbi:hypothetical protein [Longispora fulva]|uniref:Uncharacterized protein n=1 Tax=Longispora fulva TaxID=619741 RepID=A0A8J7GE27_9ACTN|nr:hypothetical protein [Longispora fulva]MBG6135971.1 hypothetical protein [Longispora fulva]
MAAQPRAPGASAPPSPARPGELRRPVCALRRVAACGTGYWRAWAIALPALAASLLGLPAGGIGFTITSVWFWHVAGFSFATAMTTRTASATNDR